MTVEQLKQKIDELSSEGVDLDDISAQDIEAMSNNFILNVTFTYDSYAYDDDIEELCDEADENGEDGDELYEQICNEVAEEAECPMLLPIDTTSAEFGGSMGGANQFDITAKTKPINAQQVLKVKYSDDVRGYIIAVE